jgi:peroxiredoxin
MAKTESTMVALESPAPSFSLPDCTSGQVYKLEDFSSKVATVVMFICNHCPYVVHVKEELVRVANDYQAKGIKFVAINSNDTKEYPDDSPAKMKEFAATMGFPFPYLFDETQSVARAYKAACTPDFFVYDAKLKCVYRGELDGARPGNGVPVNGKSLRAALDALLAGKKPDLKQRPSLGCNIKWKSER